MTPLSGKHQHQTILRLRMETRFAVRHVIIPNSQEHIIKAQRPDERFLFVKTTSPFSQSACVVETKVVNMLQCQTRVLVRRIDQGVQRWATGTGKDDGVDKICGFTVGFIALFRCCDGFHDKNSVRRQDLFHRPKELAQMLVPHRLDHFTTQDTIKLAPVLWTTSERAVIAYFKIDKVTETFLLHTILGECFLFHRKSDACYTASVLFGRVDGKTSPAKANVQECHSRLDLSSIEECIKLTPLRFLESAPKDEATTPRRSLDSIINGG
mmetsp:Transcript_37015/g.52289  ORF Transcript_37015/g.52289 Transcript_37015/m.52289 type:complete len:268 (-) Transcript_37015:273-1076(-)